MQNLDARRAKRILVAQVFATVVVTLAGLFFGLKGAGFAFIGGAIATAANALFAYWVFGRYQASEPGKLLSQFYGGEALKLALIAFGLAGAVTWLEPAQPLVLFGAFFFVYVIPPLLANRIAG